MNIPILNNICTGKNYAELSFNNGDIIILVSYNKPVAAIVNKIHATIENPPSKIIKRNIEDFFAKYGYVNLIPVFVSESELYELMAGK